MVDNAIMRDLDITLFLEDKPNMFQYDFVTFEQLMEALFTERSCVIDDLLESLDEVNDFRLGYYKGQADAYEEIARSIRHKLKHGYIDEPGDGDDELVAIEL